MPTRDESYPQLLSLAVHELRTPASVVGGYLRMLQRDGEPPLSERQKMMVDEAEKSCARLVALIAEMSDVSKLDAGLAPMTRQALDVFPLIQEVADGMHEAEDREVRLEVRGAAEGAPVIGDPQRLRAAFATIFRAILRETPGDTTVVAERRIQKSATDVSAVLVVADQRAVESAYNSSADTFDDKRGGLGLLLPIARRVIEGHGGRLWSPPGDAGRSIAILSLPLSEPSH